MKIHEMRQGTMEARVENIQKELLVIKLAMSRQKTNKLQLGQLVNKISSKAEQVETTALIREMREKKYG